MFDGCVKGSNLIFRVRPEPIRVKSDKENHCYMPKLNLDRDRAEGIARHSIDEMRLISDLILFLIITLQIRIPGLCNK